MGIEVRQLHPHIGAEVIGLDLAQPLGPADWNTIQDAFLRHVLLVFRDQRIAEEDLLGFARRFGPLEQFVDRSYQGARNPEVTRLTNLDETGAPIGPSPKMEKMSLAENWHTDSSYRAVPALATLLHGLEVPAVGGDTSFVSAYRAYEALPAALRQRIEPLVAIHSWEYQRGLVKGFPALSNEERAASPPVRHPLVRTHPQSGRRSLYISSSAQGIEGMADDAARALLDDLIGIATRPEHVYTHRWQPFDLMIWDNRCNLHRSDGFDYQSLVHRRLLHRVIVAGAPTAASAAA